MSLINLLNKLQSDGYGTIGVDLFIDTSPSKNAECVLLRKVGGSRDPDIGDNMRSLDFQAIVQKERYADSEALAESVSEALTIQQQTLGDSFYYVVFPTVEPIPFGREVAGIETFVVNFTAKWRKTLN